MDSLVRYRFVWNLALCTSGVLLYGSVVSNLHINRNRRLDKMGEAKGMSNPSLDVILSEIKDGEQKSGSTITLAIDGPAGSGKTTLAKRIESTFSTGKVIVIHMDHLYNGWEDALTAQLTKTLVNQILTPVSQGKSFGYRKYDWINKRFGGLQTFAAPDLLILEGVGSGQKAVRKFLDHLIWIEVDTEVGLRRVLGRDGDYLEGEMRIWQLRESEHFRQDNTRDCATIRLDGNFFI